MFNASELCKYNTVQTYIQHSAYSGIHYLMQELYALYEMCYRAILYSQNVVYML